MGRGELSRKHLGSPVYEGGAGHRSGALKRKELSTIRKTSLEIHS